MSRDVGYLLYKAEMLNYLYIVSKKVNINQLLTNFFAEMVNATPWYLEEFQ